MTSIVYHYYMNGYELERWSSKTEKFARVGSKKFADNSSAIRAAKADMEKIKNLKATANKTISFRFSGIESKSFADFIEI